MNDTKKTWVYVYTDEGPGGPCGQSMTVTNSQMHVRLFSSEEQMREWLKSHKHRKGSRHRERFIYGDEITGSSFEDLRKE